MPGALRLEEFITLPGEDDAAASAGPEALEEARLAGYEQGFRAGWEDAVSAQKEAEAAARAELAAHMQELSFGYHEAQRHILAGIAPLLESLLVHVLPAIGRETLGLRLLETLVPLARDQADQPLRLCVHPGSRPHLDEVLATADAPPLVVVEDASLSPGAAVLGTGTAERLFDDDRLASTLATLVREHFAQPNREEERKYG